MKTRDITANLLCQIAEELGFVTTKFNSIGQGFGDLVFIKNKDRVIHEKIAYKILDYDRDNIFLRSPSDHIDYPDVDLHDPDSIELIKKWFNDDKAVFNTPSGNGLFNTFGGLNGSKTITHHHQGGKWYTDPTTSSPLWVGGSTTSLMPSGMITTTHDSTLGSNAI